MTSIANTAREDGGVMLNDLILNELESICKVLREILLELRKGR